MSSPASAAPYTHLDTTEIIFNRILVATDFSRIAGNALKLATEIAQTCGSKLFVVNAALPIIYGTGGEPTPCEFLDATLESAKIQMQDSIDADPALAALKPQTIVAYAGAVDLIDLVAKENKVDLIILGSHGATGLERLALGSISDTMLRRASCPVLVVGPRSHVSQRPFNSIVLATDLVTTGLRGAQYATGLGERYHSKLTLMHVLGPTSGRTPAEQDTLEENAVVELTRLLPSDVSQYCQPKICVRRGKPAEEILHVLHSEGASLLVIGVKDHSPLADHAAWSKLSRLVHDAECPILCVRAHLA
jgi:nucleotide-binding universal stress UspA family protein